MKMALPSRILRKKMYCSSASPVNQLCLFFIYYLIITCVSSSAKFPYHSIGDVTIDCGSVGDSTTLDGREWVGDVESTSLQPNGKSTSSMVVDKLFHGDPVPSSNARISSTQFQYVLQVNPGQIFIRLHFYPGLYHGFERSRDLFTVEVNSFILLKNFSASLAADALGVKYIFKEYGMNVDEDQALTIVFSPSKLGKSAGNTYAFINGIEIISMPTGLYFTRDGDLGPLSVGRNNRFYYVDNQTALEMVHRLNIGGNPISPVEDSGGLFRRWSDDANYLMESEVHSINYGTQNIKYPSVLIYVAPIEIYRTSWLTNPNKRANEMIYSSFTWKIPVDVGFGYLIRLHFCELEPRITKSGERNFIILINNQPAEMNSDVIQWSGGHGIPVHRDYVVIIKGNTENGKDSLLIVVESKIEMIDGILNGIEIMKLSNPDNNLAGRNPEFSLQPLTNSNPKFKKMISKNWFATGMTIVIILVSIFVHNLRKYGEVNLPETQLSLVESAIQSISTEYSKKETQTSTEKLCHRFSFAEIKSATENFNDELVIGKGGFGMVYKGVIENGSKCVAIKRLASYSKQGAREFWMEIETLTNLRHVHLVSLIGYCNESSEMILVYEYMHHGTLADHLYAGDNFPINWEQRLKICIGAARGLDYLHAGIVPGVIHRDVKDTNILLDEKLVAKVSDFGIAKNENSSQLNSFITTEVKGTFGYLDPDYFLSHKLSKKSDVYAFGVVLLVVLCGRPVVDRRLPEDQHGLVWWALNLIKKGEVDKIIDKTLRGKVLLESLNEFVEIAIECLHNKPRERPSMAKVIVNLEYALQLEQDVEVTRSIYTVSKFEEMTFVGGPCIDQNTILYAMEPKISQENGKGSNKPARLFWPRKMFWKPSRKEDLVSPTGTCPRFSIYEVCAATSNFSSSRVIYDDNYSTVYEGFITDKNTRVSIKRFKHNHIFDADVYALLLSSYEIHIPAHLQHNNIVSLLGYCYHDGRIIVLYDYMANGTIERFLYPSSDYRPTWRQKLQICIGIGQGLTYLHGRSIIHKDLRPSNILFDQDWVPKLSCYGFCIVGPNGRIEYHTDHVTTLIRGKLPGYFPIYELCEGRLSEKSDVYSLGLIMLEILYGQRRKKGEPYRDHTQIIERIRRSMQQKTLHKIIIDPFVMPIVEESLNIYLMIINSCLKDHPSERPSIYDVVKSLEAALQAQPTHDLETLHINGGLYAAKRGGKSSFYKFF